MRIGLDFRFLALGRQNAVRGIPRFSQEQLQSVLALDRESTYLLLCNPGDDLGAIRPEIRAAPNAHIVCAPAPSTPAFDVGEDDGTLLVRYGAYQHWLEGLHLDLYHSTCHFWVSSLIMPGFDACPYVVTSYDLIPLLYPTHVPPEWAEAYHRGLLFLEQATRIAAISQATADDLVAHLGVPSDRIDLTPPAVSPCFRPLPAEATRSILASLGHAARRWPRRRVSIPSDYLLSVTDLHYTKNLPTLLAGYAELSASTRSQFPLVLAGHLREEELDALQWRARQLDIDQNLIITGRVSDHELMGLYNGATVMVHPSHHEGFGLTVAEAMRCGTPVITTMRSALPEVAGDAALLVDSEDASAFADAMDVLLHDAELRKDLSRRGRVRVERYSTVALGQATIDCYRRAAAMEQPTRGNAIRVALWSPVTPQPSGASDYADDVITALADEPGIQLDVFVDDDVPPPLHLMRTARVHHWSDFDRCARRAPYDATIYQLARSHLRCHMEQAMLRHPGIVVLDDDPALGPVLGTAACYVTFTPDAGDELRRRYPNADVRVVPFGVRDPLQNGTGFDRAMARGYLAMDPHAFVVVAAGPVDAAKHVDTVMYAFADLRRTGVDALLVVAGSIPDAAYASALQSRAQGLGIGDAFRMTGALPRTAFDAYLAASDAVVVLRDAGTRHTPAVVTRALAAGRCLVISDVPALASIPDAVCLRVGGSPQTRTDLTAALSALAGDRERRHVLEQAARAHYEATARLDRMVEVYVHLIRELSGRGSVEPPGTTVRGARPVSAGRPEPRSGALPFSKVCEVEDFAHPDLRGLLREVHPHKVAVFGSDYPRGYEHRGDWEAAMAVRSLSDHGALRPDARLLVVAARIPDVSFYLSRHAGEVVVMECRRVPFDRGDVAADTVLFDAPRVAPFAFPEERLTVRHGDARVLDYPEESFDAIVASVHAGDAGDLHEIAAAAYEMGRVLKPGGVLSLSTDIVLASDPGSEPLPAHIVLPSRGEIQRFVVAASGLEPIGDLHASASHWTLSTTRDDLAATAAWRARMAVQAEGSPAPGWTCWDLPHIVLERSGRRFTSVHVALRRAPVHPATDNSWARPALQSTPGAAS